jgi:hypothetical protein
MLRINAKNIIAGLITIFLCNPLLANIYRLDFLAQEWAEQKPGHAFIRIITFDDHGQIMDREAYGFYPADVDGDLYKWLWYVGRGEVHNNTTSDGKLYLSKIIDEQEYRRINDVIALWRSEKIIGYGAFVNNCTHFVNEVARVAGLKTESIQWPQKPGAFIARLAQRNKEFIVYKDWLKGDIQTRNDITGGIYSAIKSKVDDWFSSMQSLENKFRSIFWSNYQESKLQNIKKQVGEANTERSATLRRVEEHNRAVNAAEANYAEAAKAFAEAFEREVKSYGGGGVTIVFGSGGSVASGGTPGGSGAPGGSSSSTGPCYTPACIFYGPNYSAQFTTVDHSNNINKNHFEHLRRKVELNVTNDVASEASRKALQDGNMVDQGKNFNPETKPKLVASVVNEGLDPENFTTSRYAVLSIGNIATESGRNLNIAIKNTSTENIDSSVHFVGSRISGKWKSSTPIEWPSNSRSIAAGESEELQISVEGGDISLQDVQAIRFYANDVLQLEIIVDYVVAPAQTFNVSIPVNNLTSGYGKDYSATYQMCSGRPPVGYFIKSDTFDVSAGNSHPRSCGSYAKCSRTLSPQDGVCWNFEVQGHEGRWPGGGLYEIKFDAKLFLKYELITEKPSFKNAL